MTSDVTFLTPPNLQWQLVIQSLGSWWVDTAGFKFITREALTSKNVRNFKIEIRIQLSVVYNLHIFVQPKLLL